MKRATTGIMGATLCMATSASLANGDAAGGPGIIPQGMWVLNAGRSQSLDPGAQTLWVVKDDGKRLVWVSVVIDAQHRAKIATYDGVYGGPPSPVSGTPMTTQIVARGASSIHNFGKIAGAGDYSEDCTVFPDRKRFRCEGQVATPQGVQRYADDFDWYAESPPAARP